MDDYRIATVSSTYQNLKMDQESKQQTNDEITTNFAKFIKEYKSGNIYKYRDLLSENLQKEKYNLEFDFEDIDSENKSLADALINNPLMVIPLFEKAIRDVVYELSPKDTKYDSIPNFQFLLNTKANPKSIREINSSTIHQCVTVTGIITSASKSQIKMSKCALKCRNCGNMKYINVPFGFEKLNIPRQCDSTKLPSEHKEKCPLDSYEIITDKSSYIDVQTLKIQEPPELIPVGEIPRSYLLYCDRTLVDKVIPGARVNVVGIQCVDERNDKGSDRSSYIRVIQFITENKKSGRQTFTFTHDDEIKFSQFSKDPKIYDKIWKSIAPAIYGNDDIKKAIACLLFGGCRKRINSGVHLRGDINILLLGDPSTGKSQFLKFVERVAPVAIYTSGKGSSAAGLTASIIKDPSTGEFQLEGGAMVLADGGIVCIDEFDKMRTQDRVAIHEAMEQQTISVAKAGITTTLNSRTSVLAAANPIFGHIDDLKSTQEQIDFQTTILSRFDCIFLVKDIHNEKRDEELANHIVDISAAGKVNERREEGEIPISELKKYIAYAKMKCTPKLTEESSELLSDFYVNDRKNYQQNKKGNDIPITVRQLEAIIRLSEAIAKMSLSPIVKKNHVMEAHRLFQMSTLDAARGTKGNLGGALTKEQGNEVVKIEEAIKRRVSIGQRIQYSKLLDEMGLRYTMRNLIAIAITNLVSRGDFKSQSEKQILIRKK